MSYGGAPLSHLVCRNLKPPDSSRPGLINIASICITDWFLLLLKSLSMPITLLIVWIPGDSILNPLEVDDCGVDKVMGQAMPYLKGAFRYFNTIHPFVVAHLP
jgi:hypothetical protein